MKTQTQTTELKPNMLLLKMCSCAKTYFRQNTGNRYSFKFMLFVIQYRNVQIVRLYPSEQCPELNKMFMVSNRFVKGTCPVSKGYFIIIFYNCLQLYRS